MPIVYTINILTALKAAGYSTHRLSQEKIFAAVTIHKLRKGQMVTLKQIERLCALLDCQVGDLIEYTKEEK